MSIICQVTDYQTVTATVLDNCRMDGDVECKCRTGSSEPRRVIAMVYHLSSETSRKPLALSLTAPCVMHASVSNLTT